MKHGPTPSRSQIRAKQLALRDSLTDWWEERSRLRAQAKAERAKADAAARKLQSRGVDRVPKHLRGLRPHLEFVVAHQGSNYAHRRRWHLKTGRRMVAGTNQPHINPRRDGKAVRSGRLRKELRP